jgi:hypothetical protein
MIKRVPKHECPRRASTGVFVRAAKKRSLGGAGWQVISSEKRHEGSGEGLHALVERFESPFPTGCIAHEDGNKVNHFIVTEPTPRKVDALTDDGKDALLPKVRSDQSNFAKPDPQTYGIIRMNEHEI